MRTILKSLIIRSLILLFTASVALAQDRPAFKQEELDQMLAPIALYPDPLLSQILMASTYPLEVVQAARWSRSNPTLKGQEAVRAVEPFDWDPSVKSLAAFPQVLRMMDERLDWTQRLGEAFIVQEPQVMETVQGLRQRAAAAGNLRSGEQARVVRHGEDIVIEPAYSQIVYVPYYDPLVVYGPWWWPAYPPVAWAPAPAYYVIPAHRPIFVWGSGIAISAGFFFGYFDWPHRHVNVVHVRHDRIHARPVRVHTTWQHNPVHRRGVPFRHVAARQPFERSRMAGAGERVWLRNETAHADVRATAAPQRWREERRTTVRERREPAVSRVGPDNGASLATRPRNDNRARPAPPPEVRKTQANRNTTPGRIAQPIDERRRERRDATRPQSRDAGARTAVSKPVTRVEPRSATRTPAVNPGTRPVPASRPRAPIHANGQPLRAAPQPRAVLRERVPVSRPAAAAPARIPREVNARPSANRGGHARGNPGGTRPERRGSDRRS